MEGRFIMSKNRKMLRVYNDDVYFLLTNIEALSKYLLREKPKFLILPILK